MHVKRFMSPADRRRRKESYSTSESEAESFSDDDEPLSSIIASKERKRKTFETPQVERMKMPKTIDTSLNQAPEALNKAPNALLGEQDEAELQLLAIETRRLDFEVVKWKQQQALKLGTLQLKSEEINLKETTTKQQQQTQIMELRARLIKALDEAGNPPTQARKYLALLEG